MYYVAPILGGIVSGFVSKEVIHSDDVLEENYSKKTVESTELMSKKANQNGDDDGVGELL